MNVFNSLVIPQHVINYINLHVNQLGFQKDHF